jgi:excisionase family DNA binding protein
MATNSDTLPRLLTVDEVSNLLHYSRSTVYRHIAAGDLRRHPLAARHIGSRPFRGRARPRANRGAATGGRAGDRRMAQAVRDMVAADKAWHGVSAQVTELLATSRTPRSVMTLRATTARPHWTGVRQHEDEQRVGLLGRLKPLRRPNPAQQHQREQLAQQARGDSPQVRSR